MPPNVRKFDVDVEQFHYLVVLDDYGNVLSVTRTAVRPYVGSEKLRLVLWIKSTIRPGRDI
uniref:Uncharacterized protein n=1 Tax=Escherichia coli TaxID=562 RepID=A0A3G4RPX4_ECOLX|nr:hypothetical protein D0356_00212 [Escherichia coli]